MGFFGVIAFILFVFSFNGVTMATYYVLGNKVVAHVDDCHTYPTRYTDSVEVVCNGTWKEAYGDQVGQIYGVAPSEKGSTITVHALHGSAVEDGTQLPSIGAAGVSLVALGVIGFGFLLGTVRKHSARARAIADDAQGTTTNRPETGQVSTPD
ncbi:hypothetical protein [Fodinicola feengrottensis]|uniref:hypothetical protein n=1 Tax=Fodinicola feengrottensis TaxID=435914 RepID=UPI0013D7C727|nr:hypothetical protein [Fodinicola feengrottensis]